MKKFVIAAILAAASAYAVAGPAEIEAKYNKSCAACHNTGAAGAPKKGDKAAWAPRVKKGDAALFASVKNGLNAMPAKGLCMDCSDADFKSLIQYMSK
ncbi:MAG: cytochrome c5 family protein [Moraxellaceae bacterium]|jgi:cytochrome c5|nr:cytochrome c5 family protein [Moraxellaceae bacterium]MBP7228902.1 cytochrome c5 family protein [Moraxellaceae bacterium]MBP8851512.1 cytochrome c5 family protein [Moraxellaceae bacterium]MBP9045702.1 cytochrome c5 family protein [Moraxellaceae bacterium]MBP9730354.1 cytochrome c5 family protein [Moraxellaceae bacterium]